MPPFWRRFLNVFILSIATISIAHAQATTQPTTRPDEELSLPEADMERIREAAVFSETANAAGIEWQPYYIAFMKLERRKDWTHKQIKFIGMNFGAIQGYCADELRKETYTDEEVRQLKEKVEQETARLNGEATTRPYRKRS